MSTDGRYHEQVDIIASACISREKHLILQYVDISSRVALNMLRKANNIIQ